MSKFVKDYNSETIFPWKMVEDIVNVVKEKNAEIKTYADCKIEPSIIPDPYKYLREYSFYKIGTGNFFGVVATVAAVALKNKNIKFVSNLAKSFLSQNTKKLPQVFFHHDADRQPYKTLEMMRRQKELGIVSSSFFFYERNVWDDDKEIYDLDIEQLKEFESGGFEIGYHLNAYELAKYELKQAFEIVERDLTFFETHFKVRGFVPHGGVPGLNGINNDFIPNKGRLKGFNWYYNGRSIRGLIKDKT